ncbi:hypothetical protein SO802_022171 [Lithocarpus litseifolius]|uniref:Uncharacterized protein n=1 Tax=Lithocarpus litseifolius TaxID=425828 RepID=A0AAW2CLT3_9ROSI
MGGMCEEYGSRRGTSTCIGKKGSITEVLRTRHVTKYPSIQGLVEPLLRRA